jgi:hypothetical protein
MNGAVPPFHQYAFMVCTGTVYLYLFWFIIIEQESRSLSGVVNVKAIEMCKKVHLENPFSMLVYTGFSDISVLGSTLNSERT